MVSVLNFYAASFIFFELGQGSKPTWFNHFYLSVKFVFIVAIGFFYLDRNSNAIFDIVATGIKRHTCTNN